ncbi:MAG: M15 family metallopeptidase [Actinobacteria bacterium]|nr:M15 family metallopeptidase [Actinomycetota bacterium]
MAKRISAVLALLLLAQLAAFRFPLPAAAATDPKMFVIWSPRGIPASTQRHLEKVEGVRAATGALLATDWLMRSWMPGGHKIDRLPSGYGYPMEVTAVHPGPFSHFVPGQYRDALRSLRHGEVVISRREERLRGEGVGLKLGFRSGRRDVSAVVSQAATGGYEAILATRPREWSYRVRFFLVRGSDAVKKKRLRKAVIAAAGNIPLEIRSGKNDLLRYAPSIKPIASFKSRFGEFPAQPSSSGAFTIHPDWVGSHIRTESVPILGNVRCHKKLFRQLRGALGELRDKGLGYLIRPDEYAGCYNSRFTALPPGTRLSRHSWGIAVDVNTEGNGLGQEPHQDPRLVKIMRKWGFVWGGTWLTPDGMHFEWGRFPD